MYLFPFACVSCQRSFKRPRISSGMRPCPHCGEVAVQLNRKFKAPSRSDRAGWEVVRRLVAAGFRFQSIYEKDPTGIGLILVPNAYPTKPSEVDAFIERYGRHALRPAGYQKQ